MLQKLTQTCSIISVIFYCCRQSRCICYVRHYIMHAGVKIISVCPNHFCTIFCRGTAGFGTIYFILHVWTAVVWYLL